MEIFRHLFVIIRHSYWEVNKYVIRVIFYLVYAVLFFTQLILTFKFM